MGISVREGKERHGASYGDKDRWHVKDGDKGYHSDGGAVADDLGYQFQ